MGRYSFTIPDDPRFVVESFARAQIIGLESIPWTSSAAIQDENLVVFRHVDISGRLLMPFKSTGYGIIHLATATLPESGTSYRADLELARGSLSRLRNQVSIWQESGLRIPAQIRDAIDRLTVEFSSVLFDSRSGKSGVSSRFADIVDAAVDLMFRVTRIFSQQATEIGLADPAHVPVHCGTRTFADAHLDIPAAIIQKVPRFESIVPETGMIDVRSLLPVLDWMNSENHTGLALTGPVIDFADAELPLWLQGTDAFEHRLTLVKLVCRDIGQRYGRKLRLFNVISGISGVGHQHFNYPQQLQMSIEVLEVLDQAMPNTSTILGFDQPWGERMSMANGGVPAIEIAESLLRHGTRLSAIGLEFNIGYTPQGTFVRDPLQWVDMIDRWSQFGLPLVIYLTAPLVSESGLPDSRFAQTVCQSCLEPEFVDYLQFVIELLKCRPAVNAVVWKYATDLDNRRFPLSGLVDELGNPKRATERLAAMLVSV